LNGGSICHEPIVIFEEDQSWQSRKGRERGGKGRKGEWEGGNGEGEREGERDKRWLKAKAFHI
jgi:hypothetical protein